MNSDLNKEAPGSRSYIFKEIKIILLTSLFQQLRIYLNEKFLSSYYREKCSNAYKVRKSVLLDKSFY